VDLELCLVVCKYRFIVHRMSLTNQPSHDSLHRVHPYTTVYTHSTHI
jgi:hypothetical protein